MELILIGLYVLINFIIIWYCLKKWEDGCFTPPFIIATISLSVMLPQLTTIYYVSLYDNYLVYNLAYTMITCNIAFIVGFCKGEKRKMPSKLLDINLWKCRTIVFISAFAGLGAIVSNIGDGVIVALFMGFSQIAISYSLVYFLSVRRRYNVLYVMAFLLGSFIVLNYTFFVYGSRGSALFFFLAVLYFLYYKKPAYRKVNKYLVVSFLLFGSVLSASISLIRENMKGGKNNIDYVENFFNAYQNSTTDVGMDLGNAAVLIDYCVKNDSYNYGAIFWNGFVYNYVPERLVGKDVKESLQYIPEYDKLIKPITHGVTTVTGYFEAFATWGYLGFLTFLITGYLAGIIWSRAKVSRFYMILLLFSLGNIPLMVTHNLQYIYQRWELILMFSFLFCFYALKKRKL